MAVSVKKLHKDFWKLTHSLTALWGKPGQNTEPCQRECCIAKIPAKRLVKLCIGIFAI